MLRRALAIVVTATLACAGGDRAAAPPSNAVPAEVSCDAIATELRSYLTAVFDVHGPRPAPPWPTGDAATDRYLDEARAEVRAAMAPVDPSVRQSPLQPGVKPGRLEQELATCRGASEQLESAGRVAPAARRGAMVGIADAIRACGCKTNVRLVRALLYLIYRGPD